MYMHMDIHGIVGINIPNNKQKKLEGNESYIIKTNELKETRGINNMQLIIDVCKKFDSREEEAQ